MEFLKVYWRGLKTTLIALSIVGGVIAATVGLSLLWPPLPLILLLLVAVYGVGVMLGDN